MADDHLCGFFFSPSIKPDLDFCSWFDGSNPAVELISSPNDVAIKVGDHVSRLQSGKVSRTVVCNLANLESPSLSCRHATTANRLADSQISLVPLLNLWHERRE